MRKHTALRAVVPAVLLALTAAPAAVAAAPSAAPAAHVRAVTAQSSIPAFAGHAYRISLDNGVVFRNSYSADGTKLHWEAVEGPFKGNSGNESLAVNQVGDGLYHVNWVEKSGTTVSHVMDLKSGTVSVYWTFPTPDGGRAGELHTATLQRIA
ncbi:MoaF N-terminal domain-containing protein [Streptomyces sp. NPDC049837]|uniref:MoaF-related domain-containing protein n=1 Tax=Streptomyces sp. NPDC049837 TaxID=3155277 RepID=UPI0034149B7F